jgi:Tol biopolymer transport system component
MTMWSMPGPKPPGGTPHDGRRAAERGLGVERRQRLAFNQMGGERRWSEGMIPAIDGAMGTGSDIWVLPLQGDDRKPRPFVNKKFDEASPKFSADGKFVAYCSNEEGRPEVYVQAWPGPGWKIKLSSEGGTDPLFCHNDREIIYRNGDKMMVSDQDRGDRRRRRFLGRPLLTA